MNRFARVPSPALVIACIALFVSLGGVTYAAVKLPRGSVGTVQLKKNAVTSVKVKNGALLRADFKPGELPNGAEGPASGDLEGSYPGPTIAPNAVEGFNVVDGSITPADLDTSYVSGGGVRRMASGFTAAESSAGVTVPGLGTLSVGCGPNAGSGDATWSQGSGSQYQYVVYEAGSEGGASSYAADELPPFGVSQATFADSASNNVGRRAEFQVVTYMGPPAVTGTVSLITRPSGITSSCFYAIEVIGPS
jgi:hypothetical protein